MLGYYVFLFILLLILVLAEITRRKGFDKLSIWREATVNSVTEGEELKLSIVVENNKRLPISFLLLNEKIPGELGFLEDEATGDSGEMDYHSTKIHVGSFERVKRNYKLKASKRGTFVLRDVRVSIGDTFGLYTSDKDIEDFVELLVFPKLVDVKQLELNTTSLQGDTIIKRWIYKDPLYIKGIREYNTEDRMKDIHWQSSLKMNKLMVKDYDYTAEMETVIIFNVECGNPYWSSIDPLAIERGASLSVSLAAQCIKEGIPVGMWTNSQLISYGNEALKEVAPSIVALRSIMELAARIDYTPKASLGEFLIERSRGFSRNTTYIVVTAFLSEEDTAVLSKLAKNGFMLKLIDISSKSRLPLIKGIEKAIYNK